MCLPKEEGVITLNRTSDYLDDKVAIIMKDITVLKNALFSCKHFSVIISRKLAHRLSHSITNGRTI